MARTMTFPERVTEQNIGILRKMVRRGALIYPGANYVRKPDGGIISLSVDRRERIAEDIRIGDVVERHMLNGDSVLFNRQPSLHKMSIMSHRVRVHAHRTFRFNECVCSPYNADFDGDEMNLHLP